MSTATLETPPALGAAPGRGLRKFKNNLATVLITAISRDVYERTPAQNVEAAWALGSTRWEMIRLAVLPYGRPGVISGAMLGLGRALGETIAVFMIISPVFTIQPHVLANGGSSVSALIALRYGEATKLGTSALMAAGLALFAMTLVVNFFASVVVNRSRSGAESDG